MPRVFGHAPPPPFLEGERGMDADDEEKKTMQAIELPEQALELSFHPHRDVVASGLLNGKVCL